jgi:hypothetical protein
MDASRVQKKLLYRLNRKDYQDALGIISKGVNDLEMLTQQCLVLEPERRKQSGCRSIELFRNLSLSVYRAFRTSLRRTHSHDISVGLSPKPTHLGYDDGDDDNDILARLLFRLAISFQTATTRDSGTGKLWETIDISKLPAPSPKTRGTPLPGKMPAPAESPVAIGEKRTKRVVSFAENAFTNYSTLSKGAATVTMIEKSIELALTAPLVTNPLPMTICSGLERSSCMQESCQGYLVDPQHPKFLYTVFRVSNEQQDLLAVTLVKRASAQTRASASLQAR